MYELKSKDYLFEYSKVKHNHCFNEDGDDDEVEEDITEDVHP
jgi:hypothetical protein